LDCPCRQNRGCQHVGKPGRIRKEGRGEERENPEGRKRGREGNPEGRKRGREGKSGRKEERKRGGSRLCV
jgi:hypothetical protein